MRDWRTGRQHLLQFKSFYNAASDGFSGAGAAHIAQVADRRRATCLASHGQPEIWQVSGHQQVLLGRCGEAAAGKQHLQRGTDFSGGDGAHDSTAAPRAKRSEACSARMPRSSASTSSCTTRSAG